MASKKQHSNIFIVKKEVGDKLRVTKCGNHAPKISSYCALVLEKLTVLVSIALQHFKVCGTVNKADPRSIDKSHQTTDRGPCVNTNCVT